MKQVKGIIVLKILATFLIVSCSFFPREKQTGFKPFKIQDGYIDNEMGDKRSCSRNQDVKSIYCFSPEDLSKIKYALDGCGGF